MFKFVPIHTYYKLLRTIPVTSAYLHVPLLLIKGFSYLVARSKATHACALKSQGCVVHRNEV